MKVTAGSGQIKGQRQPNPGAGGGKAHGFLEDPGSRGPDSCGSRRDTRETGPQKCCGPGGPSGERPRTAPGTQAPEQKQQNEEAHAAPPRRRGPPPACARRAAPHLLRAGADTLSVRGSPAARGPATSSQRRAALPRAAEAARRSRAPPGAAIALGRVTTGSDGSGRLGECEQAAAPAPDARGSARRNAAAGVPARTCSVRRPRAARAFRVTYKPGDTPSAAPPPARSHASRVGVASRGRG